MVSRLHRKLMNSGMGSGSGHQALANANLSPQVIQVVSHCRSLISGDFQLVLLCPEVISWLPMPKACQGKTKWFCFGFVLGTGNEAVASEILQRYVFVMVKCVAAQQSSGLHDCVPRLQRVFGRKFIATPTSQKLPLNQFAS